MLCILSKDISGVFSGLLPTTCALAIEFTRKFYVQLRSAETVIRDVTANVRSTPEMAASSYYLRLSGDYAMRSHQ